MFSFSAKPLRYEILANSPSWLAPHERPVRVTIDHRSNDSKQTSTIAWTASAVVHSCSTVGLNQALADRPCYQIGRVGSEVPVHGFSTRIRGLSRARRPHMSCKHWAVRGGDRMSGARGA